MGLLIFAVILFLYLFVLWKYRRAWVDFNLRMTRQFPFLWVSGQYPLTPRIAWLMHWSLIGLTLVAFLIACYGAVRQLN